MKQAKRLWSIYAVDKRGKGLREGKVLVLAKNLLEAMAKAQRFLDGKYGKKEFEAEAGKFEGTIDVF